MRSTGMRPSAPRRSPFMSPRPDLGQRPLLGYTASPIERAAERRTDSAFLASLEASAGAYAVGGELVVLKKAPSGLDPLFRLSEARALGANGEGVFLGLLGGAGRFG